jgi:probable HAF family extracellular repeat protein
VRSFERAFTSTLLVISACTGVEPIEGEQPSTATSEHEADTTRNPVSPRYTIEELPAVVPSGESAASKAICARRTVVGTASLLVYGEQRAFVFDASGVTVLGTLGGTSSRGRAGNASGAIVGESTTGSTTHAFVYQAGVMQDLGTLGGAFSDAFAINNSGQIVGQSTLIIGGDVPSHAALWDGGSPIDLGTLGGAESFARDINDAGDIVGTSSNAEDPFRAHAVVWRDRVIEALDTDGALHSQAVAINEAGTIAGFLIHEAGQPYRAVIWRDGTLSDLSSSGSSAVALGLNDRGEVVGWSWDTSAPRPHAFLYTGGTMLDLEQLIDAPGWELREATDICNDGRIVGNGVLDGSQRGFVLTRVP